MSGGESLNTPHTLIQQEKKKLASSLFLSLSLSVFAFND